MASLITTKKVDLHSAKIKNQEDEGAATRELVSQVLGWLSSNGKPFSRVNTLIMNKLVYFSMKEIQKTNPSLVITNGWYKYGPCYEELREKEAPDAMEEYGAYEPRASCLDEVGLICKREFPLFESSSKADGSTSIKERYYYTYLSHVYSECVPEGLEWIQPFFESKHKLENLMYRLAFEPGEEYNKSEMQREFSDCLFQFESAICDSEYSQHVKLGELQGTTLRFSSLLEPLFNDYLLSSRAGENPVLESVGKEFARFFDEGVLACFAYKNLAGTFEAPSEQTEKAKKRSFNKAADDLAERFRLRLPSLISTLKKHELM